jgi:hypothetical protein
VKGEATEPQLPPLPPAKKQRAKTAETDLRTRRYPHNIARPPFHHNGVIPPPGSDLRKDMLTCDNCWKKRLINPGLECVRLNGRRACSRCCEGKIKCSRCPDDWMKSRTIMTEDEELEWMISGPTPSRSRGPSRKRSPSTARPRSKSRVEGKSKEKAMETSTSKSKAITSRQVNKAKARKSKKVKGSEHEHENVGDESMEPAVGRPVKRSRTDAGPSRGPTVWIEGGRQVHAGPHPPDHAIRQLQSQQAKMEARLDAIDSHFDASTAIQQQMLEALQRMSVSMQRLEAGGSSTGDTSGQEGPPVPLTRRMQHLEASNNALFAAVNGLRDASGTGSYVNVPTIPGHPETSTSPSPLPVRPRFSPERRVVAEVQTSPRPNESEMIVDLPQFAVGIQTSPPFSPVCLAQGIQTVVEDLTILSDSVAVQVPSSPPSPPGLRLDVEIQTDGSPVSQHVMVMPSPVATSNPATPSQASADLGILSPLTSLYGLPSSSLPRPPSPVSSESSESLPPESTTLPQPILRRSTRGEAKKHH